MLAPELLERYRRNRLRRAYFQEYMLRAAGEVQGKRVLDLGCGRGNDALLLAKLGAQVTGVDISEASVAFVRQRAEHEGVAEHMECFCAPVETASLPEHSFDLIWCHNILHHLTHTLEPVLERLHRWAKPGAKLALTEPVALCRLLERARNALPRHLIASTGEDTWSEHERPLGPTELALLRHHFPGLHTRHFAFFGRLERFTLAGQPYARACEPRKTAAWLLVQADYPLLSLPYLKHLGCRVVMHGMIAASASGEG
jgi:SAM-dependent methyltransferase